MPYGQEEASRPSRSHTAKIQFRVNAYSFTSNCNPKMVGFYHFMIQSKQTNKPIGQVIEEVTRLFSSIQHHP